MAANLQSSVYNPFLLPEIVSLVIDNVHMAPDLLNCACVNSVWSAEALKKLYLGSINDMQLRTPGIGSLNSLYAASRTRFARNISFVKHLLLAPETPAIDDAANPTRLASFEKPRALRHRQSTELLLRPQGRGFQSLIIPYEIIDQDWTSISDFLLPPTVEYLAIDNIYCANLMAHFSGYPALLDNRLANVKALTIYKSDLDQTVNELCVLLKCCKLRFFQFEEPRELKNPVQSNLAEVLPCLQHQNNLETLALRTTFCDPSQASISLSQNPWPDLKALHLRQGHENWLGYLPRFEKLRIIRLHHISPAHNVRAIRMISKCRHLQIVDATFEDLADAEALLEIARGCPLLRKFEVYDKSARMGGQKLSEPQFLGLLRALPNVELLTLGLRYRMNGARLPDLAHYCPRLVSLNLPEARLLLSLLLMHQARPLSSLKTMCFRSVWFDQPRVLMQSDQMHDFVTEWRRVFPKLQTLPCTADIYCMGLYTGDENMLGSLPEDDDNHDESDELPDELDDMTDELDDMTDESDDMTDEWDDLSSPDFLAEDPQTNTSTADSDADDRWYDLDEFGTDFFIFRIKLWRALGFGASNLNHEGFAHMWQTDMEIEIVGWPVMPLEAFSDPEPYSTHS